MSRHACVSTTLYLSWDAHSRAVSSRARGGFTPVRGRPDWLRRLEVVPCYMVSQGGELSSALALPNTPLLAVAPIPSKDLFPIPQWRVRDGRGLKYEKWWRAVQSLLNAFDITVERLGEQPPVNPSIATASIITRSKDEEEARAAEEQRSLEHAHALDVWQRYNTAVYWHVLPSLIVDGVHERSDLATIDSLVKGQRAHGRALIQWAMTHVDMSGLGKQSQLYAAVYGARIRDGATVSQLLVQLQHQYDHWIHLSGSKPDDVDSFKTFHSAVLHSFQNVKDGSGLAQLRYWLAGEARNQQMGHPHCLGSYATLRAALQSQAELFGLPMGMRCHSRPSTS